MNRQQFLSEWFSECEGQIELRALPPQQAHDIAFYKIDDYLGIKSFCQKKENKNLYFGLATRNGQGGTKADIISIPGAWADIDFNKSSKDADKLLRECPVPPTFVVLSGGGYHAYWKFREPTDNIEIVELINRQLAQYFESDPVHDVTRIFRVPDTFNYKYKPKRSVNIMVHNKGQEYNASDFEKHLPPLKDVGKAGSSTNLPGWQEEVLKGVGEGKRNQSTTKLAGRCLAKGFSKEETLTYLRGWNQNNRPPLDDHELRAVVESVSKTDAQNHPPQEDPLKFPNIISGVAGEFAELYSNYLEPPPHFFYLAFLTCLGSILAENLTLTLETRPQPRLYTILLGESADDRKSTAIEKVIDFFSDTIKDFPVCLGVGSAEGLQERLKTGNALLLCLDEFKHFINKCKIETSVLLTCVNTLFEWNRYEAHTKSSHINITNAYLSLLAASTIETYERIWKASFTDIGFNNRLFLVPGAGKKRFSLPKKIPLEKKEVIKKSIQRVLENVGEGLELSINEDAETIYHDWYMDLERSLHSKRIDTYAVRLMSLLTVNESKTRVDKEIVDKVISLSNWQLEVRRLHDPIDAEGTVAKMEEKIRRVLKTYGAKTDRELRQHCNANREGLWFFDSAKDNLQKYRDIVWDKAAGKWEIYRV